jgi:hypothetical protein
MKKIIAAAALAMTGFGLAAPAYAAASAATSSAHTFQSHLAVGLGHGPQQRAAASLDSGVYVIHSAGSAAGSALGIGPVPLVFPPLPVPARYFDGGSFVQRWVVQPTGDGRYSITAVPGGDYSYSLAPRGNDVFVSATTRPVAQWLIQPAGDGMWTIAAPDGDDRVVTLQRDEVPPLVLAPQDGSADQLWSFSRLDA